MKKEYGKWILFWGLIVLFLTFNDQPVFAATKNVTNIKLYNAKYKFDFNKDGTKEILLKKRSSDGEKAYLYINNKLALTADSDSLYYVFDLDKKDKYLDLYAVIQRKGTYRTYLYRYSNNKFYKYASGLYGDGKIINSGNPFCANYTALSQPGNGKFLVPAFIGGFNKNQGYHGYLFTQLTFKIKIVKLYSILMPNTAFTWMRILPERSM